jgi:hypothetical protein
MMMMLLLLQTHGARARGGASGPLQSASIFGSILHLIGEQGWLELWQENNVHVQKRVLTALALWMTAWITVVLLKRSLAVFIKITVSDKDCSKSKAPVPDWALSTLTDVLYIGLLCPFEYLLTMLVSGALCGASKYFAPRCTS